MPPATATLIHTSAALTQAPQVPTPDGPTLRALIARHEIGESADSQELLRHVLDFAVAAEQTIAEQSARIAELETMTTTDELTGLANRRGFKRALAHALDLAGRHNEMGVVTFIDLDHFKAINDGYGHEAGDALLIHTSAMLRALVRTSDVVARLGGDEFAVLMERADPISGIDRAQMLQRELNRSTARWRDMDLPVRASMGTQTFGAGDTVNSILRNADLAMYRDKKDRHDTH